MGSLEEAMLQGPESRGSGVFPAPGRSWVRGWIALAAALLCAPAIADPPPAPAGIASSLVDFKTGVFDKVLPFDVRVQIYGEVDKDVQRVLVRYLETEAEVAVDAECVPRNGGTGKVTELPGGVFEGDSATGGSKIFRINLGPLRAQRFYAFCFRLDGPIDEPTQQRLRSRAEEILGAQFAALTSGDFNPAELKAFRTRLRDEIKRELEQNQGKDLAFADGSLFSASPDSQELQDRRTEFRDLAAPVIQAQLNRNLSLGNLSSRQDDLRQRLVSLRDHPALGRAVALLRAQAQSDAGLAAFVDGHREAFDLLALSPDQLARLARGLDPQAADQEAIAETSSAEEVAAAAQRYQALVANVRPGGEADGGVGDLVEKIVGAGGRPALRLNGLAAPDVAGVRELLEPTGLLATIATDAAVLANQLDRFARATVKRAQALEALASRAMEIVRATVTVIDATTSGSFDTFQRFFASADAGLLVAPDLDEIVPHLGANIYLRPVNPDASLAELRETLGGFGKTFTRRFSLSLALTASSIAETDGLGRMRDDLFGNQSLLIGAGYRVTDVMRIGIGGLFFKQDDPNPLIDDPKVKVTPYVTLSFDAGFAQNLRGLGQLFGGGSND